MSHEWTMEAEIAENVLRIDSTTDVVHCQIGGRDIAAFYDPVVGLNMISSSFLAISLPNVHLLPTNQCLRDPEGNTLESHGISKMVPTFLDDVEVFLDFYVFEVATFNVFIGQPWSKLLSEGSTKEQLDVRIGRKEFSIPVIWAANAIAEHPPDPNPLEQAMMTTLQEAAQPDFEEDAQFFTEEEEAKIDEPFCLDESKKPSRPSIELKPLPSGLRYVFLNNEPKTLSSLVISYPKRKSLGLLRC